MTIDLGQHLESKQIIITSPLKQSQFQSNCWDDSLKKVTKKPIDILGGGFKYVLFSALFGEDSHFD